MTPGSCPKRQAPVRLQLDMLLVTRRLTASTSRVGSRAYRRVKQVAVQGAMPSALITGTGSQHGIGRGLLRAFLQVVCCYRAFLRCILSAAGEQLCTGWVHCVWAGQPAPQRSGG